MSQEYRKDTTMADVCPVLALDVVEALSRRVQELEACVDLADKWVKHLIAENERLRAALHTGGGGEENAT
jgi:hypothetical protein